MKGKTLLALICSLALSLLGASYRFGDSSHAMGLLSVRGGKALHPFNLAADEERYTLIATATVLPPYRGDVRIALEGLPQMEYEIHDSTPVVDLNPHHRPRLEGNMLRDLRPKDRLALWVTMKPRAGAIPGTTDGPQCDCSNQSAALKVYAAADNRPLMSIPIRFGSQEGEEHVH